MEINRSTIQPSDLGFNELEALYNPHKLNYTKGLELPNYTIGQKVTMGALILMLNTPVQNGITAGTVILNNSTLNISSASNYNDINKLVASLDVERTIFETDIKTFQRDKYIDDKDIEEQEIIDAYMKEVGGLYKKKRKFVL